MNILKDDYFKINIPNSNQNVSALIRCLQAEKDTELYKRWIAKEYNVDINDEKVTTRLELILKLKEKIDNVSDSQSKKEYNWHFIFKRIY